MKIKHILIALLTLCLLLTFVACSGNDTPEEATSDHATVTETPTVGSTEAPTEVPTEASTEATTEVLTEEPTEAVTESDTVPPEEVKKYREDWDDDDPENPYYNLIPVGKSYDGKTTCYDGRYDFGYAVCKTSDGSMFYSVQEAIWHLQELGGGIILMSESTDVCLKLEIPDDGLSYRLCYEFKNVDFVFNYGQIYDDCAPNAEGINGYAYYNDLYNLDNISGLDNTHVWILEGNEDFTEPGRYLMIDEFNDDPDYWYIYQYIQDGNLTEWPGLPWGEYLP